MNSARPPSPPHWHAELKLGFARREQRTVLSERRHVGPLRIQKALYPEGDAVCQALLLHPPSGIAGGDHLHIAIEAQSGSHAQITTPGAGKWYRSDGTPASQNVDLRIESGATLEWLPQESIVFSGAQARMQTRVSMAADARFLAWDILCLGRTASGERFAQGRLDLDYRLERGGRPLWIERGRCLGDDPLLDSPAAWAGQTVSATLLCSFPELPEQAAALLEALRALAPADQARHALSHLPGGLLIARYLGHNSEAARLWLTALWQALRPAFCQRPAQIPRIWNT